MVTHHLVADGRLRHVLDGWEPREELIHAVMASRRGLLPAVRALIDFVAARFDTMKAD